MQYHEEIGKPTLKYLKGKQYSDAKNFAGECEAVVVVAKGQRDLILQSNLKETGPATVLKD